MELPRNWLMGCPKNLAVEEDLQFGLTQQWCFFFVFWGCILLFMISVGRWVNFAWFFVHFVMVQKETLCFFWCQKLTVLRFPHGRESLFVCKSTWTLISLSLVPLENLMFGFGPVSPSESHKGGFPKFYPSKKEKRRSVAFADAWRINFSWTPSAISPCFLGPAGRFWRLFLGFCNAQKAMATKK